MSNAQVNVDYGWRSNKAPCSCDYIVPTVLDVLRTLKPRRVLDLGAGNGALCQALFAEGYEVVGVEPDSDGINIARQSSSDVRFYQLSVDDSPDHLLDDYTDGFDVVVSTEVIEHLYRPRNLIQFASKLLPVNGHLVLSAPYHGYFKNLVISIANKWDSHANPMMDGGHIKFFSRKTITSMLNEYGFNVIRFSGVGRLPFLWKSMIIVAIKK